MMIQIKLPALRSDGAASICDKTKKVAIEQMIKGDNSMLPPAT